MKKFHYRSTTFHLFQPLWTGINHLSIFITLSSIDLILPDELNSVSSTCSTDLNRFVQHLSLVTAVILFFIFQPRSDYSNIFFIVMQTIIFIFLNIHILKHDIIAFMVILLFKTRKIIQNPEKKQRIST